MLSAISYATILIMAVDGKSLSTAMIILIKLINPLDIDAKNKLSVRVFLLSDKTERSGYQRVTTVPMGSPAMTLWRLPYTSMLKTWMGNLLSRAMTVAVMSMTLRPRL